MSLSIARRRQRGFTLVEMVVVIVIMGIVSGMAAMFIRVPVQGYLDTAARAELADIADIATRRIARDVRLALPNSVRVSNDGRYLELLLTKTGGRYLSEDDVQAGATGNALVFNPLATSNLTIFTILGAAPSGVQAIVAGDFIVVNNLGGDPPSNAYDCGVQCNRATVGSIVGSNVTLNSNPFRSQSPSMPSNSGRFQVVTTPVTYFCDGTSSGGGVLRRYSGYAIQATQPIDAAAAPLINAPVNALLATQVAIPAPILPATTSPVCFSFFTLPNMQRGIVSINLSLGTAGSSAGQISLVQQAQVNNTP